MAPVLSFHTTVSLFFAIFNIIVIYIFYVNFTASSLQQSVSVDCQRTVKEHITVNHNTALTADIWKTSNAKKCNTLRQNVTNWSLSYWSKHPDAKDYGCKANELLNWVLDLQSRERKVYSQNGEDGIIEAIFEKIGVITGFFVEFGVQEGKECNSRYLRYAL